MHHSKFTEDVNWNKEKWYYCHSKNVSGASDTAWKVSVFGVILVRIFPHSDWIWKDLSVSLRIQSECGKIRTRITRNMDTFYEVWYLRHLKAFEIISNVMPVLLLILFWWYFNWLQMHSEKFLNIFTSKCFFKFYGQGSHRYVF